MRKRSAASSTSIALESPETFSREKVASNAPSSAVVLAPPALVPIRTVSQLDVRVSIARGLSGDLGSKAWELGRVLSEMRDAELWKLRTHRGEGGREVSSHKSWEGFVRSEIGISAAVATKFMAIGAEYTQADARELGVSRAAAILNAPPDARPQLVEKAKAGATKIELAADVRESRDATGYAKGKGRPRKQPAPPLPPPPKADDLITVVGRAPGMAEIVMKKRKDGAYVGSFQPSNEVSQKFTFRLPKTKGGPAQLRIHTKRDAS